MDAYHDIIYIIQELANETTTAQFSIRRDAVLLRSTGLPSEVGMKQTQLGFLVVPARRRTQML